MCGEIDERDRVDEELFDRFLELASRYGVSTGVGRTRSYSRVEGGS